MSTTVFVAKPATLFVALVATLFGAPAFAAAPRPLPAVIALPPSHNPAVTIAIQFHSGAVDDPPGQAGVTELAAHLMAEGGTQALDAKALLEALFPMAAEIRTRVDKETTTFWATVHKDHLERIVPILTDVVAHPRWDAQQFHRLKKQQMDFVAKRLRQGNDEALGKETLGELMYINHPYGRLEAGHVSELHKLTLDDVQKQAQRVFTRDRLTIGVAGGYPKDLIDRLQQALSSLPDKSTAPRVTIPNQALHHPRVLLVEKNTPSTAISIGAPWSLSRKDPDFAALLVARAAFGEHRQFLGRLQQRLREARGLNYGDYAYIEHFVQEGGEASTAQTFRPRHQQDFTIWLRPVQNANALFAVRAALFELHRSLTDEPFSAEEVNRAKGFLDGYVLLWAQTDARKLGYAMDGAALGTPDFLGTLRDQIRKVTVADVNRAWKKVGALEPGLEIVMVGPDAKKLKQAILTNAPSPMNYPRDASGKSPDKPAWQLAADQKIASYPIGAKGDNDVAIIPVGAVFE